jgi:hypothetical protein
MAAFTGHATLLEKCLHGTIRRSRAMARTRVGMPDLERAVLPTAARVLS